eukprot:TRINITY_DN5730_c0_g1_i4.p1 TRINITY_DN5730_c0_g1~~TRINITY_DN5730_c0_g1_i4.p1  ORF type:complete len:1067 (+),score=227.92 TRINITY_DN5730_c0_g1_i4:277-3201(+)
MSSPRGSRLTIGGGRSGEHGEESSYSPRTPRNSTSWKQGEIPDTLEDDCAVLPSPISSPPESPRSMPSSSPPTSNLTSSQSPRLSYTSPRSIKSSPTTPVSAPSTSPRNVFSSMLHLSFSSHSSPSTSPTPSPRPLRRSPADIESRMLRSSSDPEARAPRSPRSHSPLPSSSSSSSQTTPPKAWSTYWTRLLTPTTLPREVLESVSRRVGVPVEGLTLATADEQRKRVYITADDDVPLMMFKCKRFVAFEGKPRHRLSRDFSEYMADLLHESEEAHPVATPITNTALIRAHSLSRTQSSGCIERSPKATPSPTPISALPKSNSFNDAEELATLAGSASTTKDNFLKRTLGRSTRRNKSALRDKVVEGEAQSEPTAPAEHHPNSTPAALGTPLAAPSPALPDSVVSTPTSSYPSTPISTMPSSPSRVPRLRLDAPEFLAGLDSRPDETPDHPSPESASSNVWSSRRPNREAIVASTGDAEAGKAQPTSAILKERLHALDNYFQHHYKNLFHYLLLRAQRKEALESFLKSHEGRGLSSREIARQWRDFYAQESKYLRTRRARMNVSDFKVLSMIGKGGFGQVFLATHKDSGEVVTLKRIMKNTCDPSHQIASVAREKEVMIQSDTGTSEETPHSLSVWITKLLYSFQDEKYLYLAMEFHCGGDFRVLLSNLGQLPEDMARFYMAEMVAAVEALHSMGYIHRDIKPSNFVVDRKGHLKLIDFGLTKEGMAMRNGAYSEAWQALRNDASRPLLGSQMSRTTRIRSRQVSFSCVGSPEYMAPEMVEGKGYDFTYDLWSLGCVFLEMMLGYNPFCDVTVNGVFLNILNYPSVLDWSAWADELTPNALSLAQGLLSDTDRRLGREGIHTVKSHPFFEGVQWDGLRNLTPPFVPKVESETDTSYFEGAVEVPPGTSLDTFLLPSSHDPSPSSPEDTGNASDRELSTSGGYCPSSSDCVWVLYYLFSRSGPPPCGWICVQTHD